MAAHAAAVRHAAGMRRAPSLSALFLVPCLLALPACGSNEPYCSNFVDGTGRAAAYCPGPRDEPVCDEPGDEARFEEGASGVQLVGGQRATCNAEDEVVCPTGTLDPPYCITDPEL